MMNVTKKMKNLRLFALFVVPSIFIWFTVVIIPLFYGDVYKRQVSSFPKDIVPPACIPHWPTGDSSR